MKKTIISSVCAALLLCLMLAGCAGTQNVQNAVATESTDLVSEETEKKMELIGNIFLDAETTNHPVSGGGLSRTITVSKTDALAASAEEYSDFLSDRVKLFQGEYFTLLFTDGTGVIYYGCDPANAVYGKADKTGAITEPMGYIMPNDDNTYKYVSYNEVEPASSPKEIRFKNLNFENPNGYICVESDDSIDIDIGDSKLSIFAAETNKDLAVTSITVQNSAVKAAYSDITNEDSFTQTIAGFDAKGISFSAKNNEALNVVFAMSFFDGEYVYTFSFTSILGSDSFSSDLDSFLKFVELAKYVE